MIVNNTIQSTVVSGLNEQWELLQKSNDKWWSKVIDENK
jgi:hypothetical protein